MRQIGFSAILFISVNVAFGQQNWVLKKDKDSVRVFTCHTEDSKFKTIRASFTVNASLSQLINTVLDVENYSHWQYNTINPRLIKRINDHEIIYYAEVIAPWPMSNRDIVAHLSIKQNPGTKTLMIITKSVSGVTPEIKNIIRVPESLSRWTITKISESKLSVDFTMKIDPGGSVPAWIVNMVCAEAPYVTFRNLRNRISLEKKNVSSLPFILN